MSIKQKRSLCSFLMLAALALSAYAFDLAVRGSALKAVTAARESMTATTGRQTATQQTSSRGPVQNVRLALYDAGIYPHEMHAQPGPLIITLVDYTAGATGLVIERESDRVRQNSGDIARNGVRWRLRRRFNLASGTYRVYDASKSESQAILIIEP